MKSFSCLLLACYFLVAVSSAEVSRIPLNFENSSEFLSVFHSFVRNR